MWEWLRVGVRERELWEAAMETDAVEALDRDWQSLEEKGAFAFVVGNCSLVISRPRSWSSRALEFVLSGSWPWSRDLCSRSRSWSWLEEKVLIRRDQDQDQDLEKSASNYCEINETISNNFKQITKSIAFYVVSVVNVSVHWVIKMSLFACSLYCNNI